MVPNGLDYLVGMYCPDPALVTHPYVSPYYADYKGMPPMLLAWDESESLSVDSQVLRDKALAAGVEVHAKSCPDCFHAFASVGRGTPETEEILADTVAFINAHI